MNQLLYLFDSLRSLGDETALLEACDWCEERLQVVREAFHTIVTSSLNEDSDVESLDDVVELIKFKLTSLLSEKEVEVCLHILEENIKRFFLLKKEVDYEN
tara:strand:- start:298 stop:600 length:303 start_codon:yes stop_codon:yes gene_type:complete